MMDLPPYARRLDVGATRAAFSAGTLGTVGDDAPHGDAERDAVVPQPDGLDRDYVEHLRPIADVLRTPIPIVNAANVEHVRQSRLTRWQAER